jgi:hypothetical protein
MQTKYGHLTNRHILNAYNLQRDHSYMLQYAVAAAKGYTAGEIFSGNYRASSIMFDTIVEELPSVRKGDMQVRVLIYPKGRVPFPEDLPPEAKGGVVHFVEHADKYPSDELVATILLLEKTSETG